MDIGTVKGYTEDHVHVATIAGTFDLPRISTYHPQLDEHVTIQDGLVLGAVVATRGPEE